MVNINIYQEPTEAEIILRDALYDAGLITCLTNQVYCFTDKIFFTWDLKEPPEYCAKGHKFEKGECCRPDIVLIKDAYDLPGKQRYGVVYVNGPIHYKSYKNMRKDHMQIKQLQNDNIQVFVVLNEDLYDKRKKPRRANIRTITSDIREIFEYDSSIRYDTYRKSKTFEERVH